MRDVVRTRYVALELMEAVNAGLAGRGLEIEDVWSGVEASRRVVDAMPSGDVAVSLLTEYHRDSTLKWKRNHIFDIDALSVAVPYCDAVVADADAIDKLRRSRCRRAAGCAAASVAGRPRRTLELETRRKRDGLRECSGMTPDIGVRGVKGLAFDDRSRHGATTVSQCDAVMACLRSAARARTESRDSIASSASWSSPRPQSGCSI